MIKPLSGICKVNSQPERNYLSMNQKKKCTNPLIVIPVHKVNPWREITASKEQREKGAQREGSLWILSIRSVDLGLGFGGRRRLRVRFPATPIRGRMKERVAGILT